MYRDEGRTKLMILKTFEKKNKKDETNALQLVALMITIHRMLIIFMSLFYTKIDF